MSVQEAKDILYAKYGFRWIAICADCGNWDDNKYISEAKKELSYD